ncbi:CXE carboxylesterase [Heracleum sosnowskyi]|uniref:CXE carboxylesterase n=1 Tax=Heracleum sosnowskyi TaxID=360622 RepID=A0AAD8JGC7_9APIA|nr:CXE carboxylesterase [Heracleum sosnowskyi]
MTSSDTDTQIVHNFPPFFQVLQNGAVKRFFDDKLIPPTNDTPNSHGVITRDVVVSAQPKVSARLFLPEISDPTRKLPVLIYIHGGAFSIGSGFSEFYTSYVSSVVANSNVIGVSVDYRLAPENPLPACYDDSWEVFKWVALHGSGQTGSGQTESGLGSDPWLTNHADFTRVFLEGDSAGANIAHDIAIRVGSGQEGVGVKISGMVLVHPYFGSDEVTPMMKVLYPGISRFDDPRYNPAANPCLMGKIKCGKVLVCVAEKDGLKDRGVKYYEGLKKSDYEGEAEFVETRGEAHVFHLFNQTSEKAGELMKIIVSFLNK